MFKKKKRFFLLPVSLIVFLFLFFFAASQVSAEDLQVCTCKDGSTTRISTCSDCGTFCSGNKKGQLSCIPVGNTSEQASSTTSASVSLTNPLGNITSPQVLAGKVINSIFGIVGSLALVMFIIGGLTWMTSAGSADKVKKGRDIIVWSAIGLAIIFASYGLVKFVILAIK